jgi:hypothetical protein
MKRGNWTVSETTNKIFIPNLKSYKVDTHQVVSQCYKDANQLWIAARAATKAFEDLSYVQEDGGDNKIRMDIIEKIQKLAIYIFATAKSMEKEARDQSTTALRIPSNIRYLEEESSKKLVFSTVFVEKKYNIDRMDLEDEGEHQGLFQLSTRKSIPFKKNFFLTKTRRNKPATGDKLWPNTIQPMIKISTVLQTPSYPIVQERNSRKTRTLRGVIRWKPPWRSSTEFCRKLEVHDTPSLAESHRIQGASSPVP